MLLVVYSFLRNLTGFFSLNQKISLKPKLLFNLSTFTITIKKIAEVPLGKISFWIPLAIMKIQDTLNTLLLRAVHPGLLIMNSKRTQEQ